MADLKVSALTAATTFLDSHEFPVNQAGASRKVTGTQVKTWLGTPHNVYTGTGQTPAAATRTYLAGSSIPIPTGLAATSFFQWRWNMTKTAAGSAASTIDIALGTNGTTADTAQCSFTKPAGTAVGDEAWCTVDASVFTIGASGGFRAEFVLVHNLLSTGHATVPCVVVQSLSNVFNTITPTFIGLCITTGAADAITIYQVTAQAFNLI